MRARKILSLFIGLGMLLSGSAVASDRYVVAFHSTLPAHADAIIEAAGGQKVNAFDSAGVAIATSSNPSFAEVVEAAAEVDACGRLEIRLASELFDDFVTPAFPLQWNLQRVNAEQAWPVTRGSHDTVVAVIDTGIATNHPELAPNLVDVTCFAAVGICQDYPINGHGNQMAGIIAAAGNLIAGGGPDLGLASLNVVEFVDLDGDGFPETPVVLDEAIWEALFYAAEQGYEVANMSFGSQLDESDPAQKAEIKAWKKILKEVEKQGVTLIASAGNEQLVIEKPLVQVPAGLHKVVAVGATAIRPLPVWPQPGGFDIRAFYSNTGTFLTIAAPGGDCGLDGGFDPCDPSFLILSTDVDFITDPGCVLTEDCAPIYVASGGTSSAAATVSAAAGLIIDAWDGPDELKPEKVEKILTRTAEPVGPAVEFGAGVVDVEAAVLDAAGLQ